MNQRFVTVLLFAFVVAAGVSVLLYKVMANRASAKAGPPVTQIIVAARNLEVGTLVKETDLRTGDWAGERPQGAAIRKEDVIGRGVIAATYAGEPLLDTRLAPKGAGAGLAATIPPGMRASAVRVNEVVGVGGFVVPGMRVDVIISGNPPNSQGLGSVTKTVLQNIEVLSAGQNFQKDAEGKPVSVPVVNLLVTPDQAEVLALASNQATIQLVLRNPLDNEIAKPPGTAVARLFSLEETKPQPRPVAPRPSPRPAPVAAPPPPPAPKPVIPVVVEMIQGTKRVEAKFAPEEKQQ